MKHVILILSSGLGQKYVFQHLQTFNRYIEPQGFKGFGILGLMPNVFDLGINGGFCLEIWGKTFQVEWFGQLFLPFFVTFRAVFVELMLNCQFLADGSFGNLSSKSCVELV